LMDGTDPDRGVSHRSRSRTMYTKIDQQVAMDEALVPHAKRLRIGRSNFRLLSDIKSKESTLQLEFWATATVHHYAIRFKMDNKKYIVNLESFRDMLHICPRVPGQSFAEPPFEEEILAFIRFLGHSAAIRKLTDVNINKNSNAYKEYYVVAIGVAPPKLKASIRKTRSSFDTTITPPTAAAGPRLTTSEKGKQAAKASKAKSLSSLSEDEGKDGDGDEEDDGDDGEEGDEDDDDQEVERDDEKDDEEEGKDDEQEYDEETRDEESFVPILKTFENSDDEGNGEKDLGLNVGREEGHVEEEEEEEDELYRDININQGMGIQTTLKVEDSHVTLTPVNPDGQEQSSSVSSQFVTSMLNLTLNVEDHQGAGQKQVKVQVSKILPRIEQTMNEQLEAEVLTRSSHSSKTSYAVAADLSEMELKKILIEKMEGNKSIQRSDEQRNLYKALVEAYESDKIILDTYEETVTLKRGRDDDTDKDEEPSAGPDRGSNRRREGKEPETVSALKEKETRSAGKSTQGTKSRQASASESAIAKEPMQTTFQMEEPSHLEFDTGAEDQPIVQSSQHPEWFSQQQKSPSLDRDWNKTVSATHESIQPWISELAKLSDSRSSFNELMDTPLDFSNFLINRLKRRMEDLQLGVESYQKKLNLTKPDTYRSDLKRKEAYTTYSNLRGFIYQNKDKKTMLMRIDELHKFSDGTLTDVHTTLDDLL
nr:hypothetical protein [Tanacetum cinerariifolium]